MVFCKTLLQEGLLGGSGLQFFSPEEASSVVFCKTQLQEGTTWRMWPSASCLRPRSGLELRSALRKRMLERVSVFARSETI